MYDLPYMETSRSLINILGQAGFWLLMALTVYYVFTKPID